MRLQLQKNRLDWLPIELNRLPVTTAIFVSYHSHSFNLTSSQLGGNPFAIDAAFDFCSSRLKLPEIFAATTAMIRSEATTLAIGLQDLSLSALVTLEIVDAAFPNAIPMHKKWCLITAVKHFHQRRA